ncbi:MAG TPA: DUF401 family protein [bacterium]
MVDLFKIITVLLAIIFLTKRKWNLGLVMIFCTFLIALFYKMSLHDLGRSFIVTSTDFKTVNLILALTLIRGFEYILRKKGVLAGMMDTLKGLLRGSRAVIPVMPSLIGMLPSVGGALFSAPMVQETTKNLKISPEKKSFINYWFRHPWEYILPLYPGIILASGIAGVSLRKFIIENSLYALGMVVIGYILGLRKIKMDNNSTNSFNINGVKNFLPFITLLIFVLVLHFDLLTALILELILVFVFLRSPFSEIAETIKKSISLEIITLIFGIILFKTTMEISGAVKNLSIFFTANQVPLMLLLFFLPFITGLLTGFTVGFVGSTFPLLLSLIKGNTMHHVVFAFCSGYVGVLLSPVHLCLVLTRQYFDADMWRVYMRILPAAMFVLAIATLRYLFQ